MAQVDKTHPFHQDNLLTNLLNKYAYLNDNGATANRIYNLILKIDQK